MEYTVTNKSNGRVAYDTPSFGHRGFVYGEHKTIDEKELFELVQQPGGRELFYDCLYCGDTSFVEKLLDMKVEPEYKIAPEDMPHWMNESSLDEFKDGLDFAPDGMKDLIKKLAVEMPLNDYTKRKAILDQLGFDVTKAVENSGDELATAAPAKTSRRVQGTSEEAPAAPARRVIRK